ncbi:MAG: ribonuclease HI family protein [Dehalococcoidia bacterium]
MTNASKAPWVVYSDGASRGNPGPAAAGALVLDPAGKVCAEISEPLGIQTNNFAEYQGLIKGLEAAIACGARSVEVRMDSELLVKQATGVYRVKHPGLIPLSVRVNELRRKLDAVTFKHVRREFNKQADALANRALDAMKP